MRNFKTEGIIIKRRNYKDVDRILTVLTKTHGKIYVKAVGVRKITSRRAGHIELLNHCVLNLYQGHSFPLLTETAAINNFSEIKSDLEKVGMAYHLCELVDGLCPENQENGRVFELLKETLSRLNSSLSDPEFTEGESKGEDEEGLRQAQAGKVSLSDFETQLLSLLGYWDQANFAQTFDTQNFIENILERRLKSRKIFLKF